MASYSLIITAALATLVTVIADTISEPLPAVKTSSGPVRGSLVSLSGEVGFPLEVQEYLGIPYARPPLGELRFQPPQPPEPWREVLLANTLPNACVQRPFNWSDDLGLTADLININTPVSEDCLYLNVWTPHPRPQKPVPVLVWIYGGGFVMGSSAIPLYDGKVLAGYNNVIVVSMQYRVDVLGFLSLGIDGAMGNAGLLDQQLAMRWVKENIAAFGGDTERITLFGESAGAASVSLHLLSAESRKYFTRGIMQSGVASMAGLTLPQADRIHTAAQLAEALGCPHDVEDKVAILRCLRGLDADLFSNHSRPDLISGPVQIDGTFLTKPPAEIIASGDFYHTDILLGSNENEGTLLLPILVPGLVGEDKQLHLNRSTYRDAIGNIAQLQGYNQFVHEAAAFMYTDWRHPHATMELLHGLDQALGDSFFVCPTAQFARAYAEANARTYAYMYAHRPSVGAGPEWGGVQHGSEVIFVFGNVLKDLPIPKQFTAGEKEFSKVMMKFWVNFAESGDPNGGGSAAGVKWPRHLVGDGLYLALRAEPAQMVPTENPRLTHCAFWDEYVPTLANVTVKSESGSGNVSDSKSQPGECVRGKPGANWTLVAGTVLVMFLIGLVCRRR